MALAVAFLLLALFVQLGMLMAARNAAEAAVAASARRASRPGVPVAVEQARLQELIRNTIPGAERVEAEIWRDSGTARAQVRFAWVPPGPRWIPIHLTMEAAAPLVVPP